MYSLFEYFILIFYLLLLILFFHFSYFNSSLFSIYYLPPSFISLVIILSYRSIFYFFRYLFFSFLSFPLLFFTSLFLQSPLLFLHSPFFSVLPPCIISPTFPLFFVRFSLSTNILLNRPRRGFLFHR